MAEWRVFLNGQNFWLQYGGKPERMGFYTTREVTADDSESAELAAVQLLRDDPKLQECLNDKSDPPQIFVEELVEIAERDPDEVVPGYAFYAHETDA